MKLFFSGFCLLAAGILGGCRSMNSTDSIPAVSPFAVDRYLGTWNEIARMPHSFERGLVEVTACYSLRPDGKINVVNTGFRDGKNIPFKASPYSRTNLISARCGSVSSGRSTETTKSSISSRITPSRS